MEEKLKKFKRNFIIRQIILSSFNFMLIYPLAFNIVEKRQWLIISIAIAAVCLLLGFIFRKSSRKKEAERIRIMPMIISIKDTPESLKKERTAYSIIYVLMFAFGFTFAQYGPFKLLFCIVFALSAVFSEFFLLTNEKIKYLESKPEGL